MHLQQLSYTEFGYRHTEYHIGGENRDLRKDHASEVGHLPFRPFHSSQRVNTRGGSKIFRGIKIELIGVVSDRVAAEE